jgi:hypothetical protein
MTFLNKFDTVLKTLESTNCEFIICCDFNINYLVNKLKGKILLDSLLPSHNLFSIVNFPTRIKNNHISSIDIFLNYIRLNYYTITPFINRLSDHDAQCVLIHDIDALIMPVLARNVRKINTDYIAEFTYYLSFEAWDDAFMDKDVNSLFNDFFNNYLRIFIAAFLVVMINKYMKNNNKKNWITKKLRNQCQFKRDLYLLVRNNNNNDLLNYYKRYTKELSKKIRKAKKEYYNNMIKQSKNKITTTWNIIKMEKGNTCTKDNIIKMDVNGSVTYNPQIIANVMNQYFLLVGNNNLINKTKINCKDVMDYLLQAFGNPFPRILHNNITRYEVEKVIKSLNASNSCGYDEIPAKVVKISSSYISSPLTKLCNRIFSTGVFPDYLKYSKILPLFKSGSKDKIDSYIMASFFFENN